MNIFSNEICTETAPSNGVILDECKKQDQHQSAKQAPYSMHNLDIFGADKVEI